MSVIYVVYETDDDGREWGEAVGFARIDETGDRVVDKRQAIEQVLTPDRFADAAGWHTARPMDEEHINCKIEELEIVLEIWKEGLAL